MLALLRHLKHELFMKDSFRKYAAYAFGELLLVVIGILVALQIDNWNEDRKERTTLDSYLKSIARNMQEDLAELESLRGHRLEALLAASQFAALRGREKFEVDEIFFLSHLWALSARQLLTSANTSGFEALKNSGVLDRLQGSGIERLLSRYYDTVNQIAMLENSLYDATRPVLTELRREQPREMEPYAVINPTALPPARFQELQPLYRELIGSPMLAALVETQFSNQALMLQYDSLRVLGEAFIHAVEAGALEPAGVEVRTPLEDFNQGLGLPDIVSQGRPALEAYWLDAVTPLNEPLVFRFDSYRMRGEELHVDYPGGSDWAAIYWSAVNLTAGRTHMDFSRFTKLELELKGAQGGEKLLVHVKDADYPDDRAPVSKELTLDADWRSYEIELTEFEPNDLTRLHVVLGFLIYPAESPLAFSIRKARFQ
jgi:hypothetical protein